MIHPTAVVDPQAKVPSSCEIGPYCVVGSHVEMGEKNVLHSHVVVEGHTRLGNQNQIFPFAVLGGKPQDLKYKGEPTRLEIGNNNTIREAVTMNLGTVTGGGVTKIGDGNLVMAYCHLGHDCHLSNSIVLANTTNLAGHVTIQDNVVLGGACFVGQFLTIGAYCYLGGGSFVEKDVPPYCTGYGNRFKVKGVNIVGLRRRGFSRSDVLAVLESHKIFYRSGLSRAEAVQKIASQFGDNKAVIPFLEFVKNSKKLTLLSHFKDGDDEEDTEE